MNDQIESDLDVEDVEFDCGINSNGECEDAGSEGCELDCPYRDEQIRKRMKKRGPK